MSTGTIAQLILQKTGYRVDVVEDGQQAVDTCQQNHYDLILMDIQMPLMDGHEATKRIRKWKKGFKAEKEIKAQSSELKGKDSEELSAFSFQPSARAQRVPIIAMTGNAAPGSFDNTLYPGMNDCVGKPLQRDFLLSVVKKWICAESKTGRNGNPADETSAKDKRPENNHYPLDLDRAIQGNDYGAIGSEAHAINGASANLTADNLARLACELEQAAEKQQPELTGNLADQLEQEFNNPAKYIQRLKNSAA